MRKIEIADLILLGFVVTTTLILMNAIVEVLAK